MYWTLALYSVAPGVLGGWQPPQGVLPILGWVNPPAATVEQYRLMRDAGFTILSHAREHEMAVAAKVGLLALYALGTPDPATPEGRHAIDRAIELCRRYPNCVGYVIKDEPNARDFPLLGRIVAYLRQHDPQRLAFINLFPTYANSRQLGTATYREHVERYVTEVKPQLICFDNYPCIGKDGWRADYYENLEIIRDAALRHKIPMWAFILVSSHGPYRTPSEAELRLQGFSDLAYGATGIFYFTYGLPRGYRSSVVDADGKPTGQYPRVRRVNAMFHAFTSGGWGNWVEGTWFGGPTALRVKTVYHVPPPLPRGTKALDPEDPDNWVLACTPGNVIAATLVGGPTGGPWIMLVNKDWKRPHTYRVRVRGGDGRCLYELPRRKHKPGEWDEIIELRDGSASIRVGPGMARVFAIGKPDR